MVSVDNLDEGQHTEHNHPQVDHMGLCVEGEPPHTGASIVRVRADEDELITRLSVRLNDTNWAIWRKKMSLMLRFCDVDAYVKGQINCPDNDPEAADIWSFNDAYAQLLIVNNIEDAEMVNVDECDSAHEMWANLEAVHESRGYQTVIAHMRNLLHTTYELGDSEGEEIGDHLGKLEQYWEQISFFGDDYFELTDTVFKVIIISSLPPSWDTFTEPYVGLGGRADVTDNDPKRRLTSQQLIEVIKEEYVQRQLTKRQRECQSDNKGRKYKKRRRW